MGKKVSFWIDVNGIIYETEFQEHIKKIAEVLKIEFDPKKSIHYYNLAFDKGFIRVCKYNSELNIQLFKPANNKQISLIEDLFDISETVLVTFGNIEGYIYTKLQLKRALSGLNPYKN